MRRSLPAVLTMVLLCAGAALAQTKAPESKAAPAPAAPKAAEAKAAPNPATGDGTDMDALRNALRTDKKAYVASVMQLTDAEAKKFWPVYDAYQRDLNEANQQLALVVKDLAGMSGPINDLQAKQLANRLIAADELEVKSRRTLHNRLRRPLPGRSSMAASKAARYLQLESKFRAVQDYDLAKGIPLVK